MRYQKWNIRTADEAGCAALQQEGIRPLTAWVFSARGITTGQEARKFLSRGTGLLQDPMRMKDMDVAIARIERGLSAGEKMAIYGDYDVDGITAACLLTHYLRGRGGDVTLYIPDRLEEGYGLNRDAVTLLARQGVTLIITVDCGITALEETEYAATQGVDVVITDHHECKERLPAAVAVVDPHREDCDYPFNALAGVGVALKLVLAMGGGDLLETYVDLCAIGTVADVMRLDGENRAIVTLGLALINKTPRPGIRHLLREAGAEGKPVTAVTIGYTLAPRLNAAGRMGCAQLAASLLLTEDEEEAQELAAQLCALNRQRQNVEGAICEECIERLDREDGTGRLAIVMDGKDWHQGVVGIVASRLAEKYAVPAFMICVQDGRGKGSCRSFGGANLFQALESCSELLLGFGGHALAAGFTILEENIPAFRSKIEEYIREHIQEDGLITTLDVDGVLDDAGLLCEAEVRGLNLLEPYGAGNPRPVFALMDVCVAYCAEVGCGRHLKLNLRLGERVIDAIFFSATIASTGVHVGDKIDLVFIPQINEFRGKNMVQLQVCDLRPAVRSAAEGAADDSWTSPHKNSDGGWGGGRFYGSYPRTV